MGASEQDITEQVKLRFDAGGFSISFPQRGVHLLGHQIPLNGSG